MEIKENFHEFLSFYLCTNNALLDGWYSAIGLKRGCVIKNTILYCESISSLHVTTQVGQ